MPALPFARLPELRRILLSGSLLVAFVTAAPAVPTYARVNSDDPATDRALTTELQTATAAATPAMRPLVSRFDAVWPTHGEITTYFGEVGPFSPRGHSGVDVAGPQGTPVVAADEGEVLKAYWSADGYGGLVIIGHPSGYETWYGHLSKFTVEKGEQVKRGERIGLMGSTGFSTGPHLHFEVRQDGQLRDPLNFLSEARLQDVDW